jgi:hydroxyacylglutathione hydrolase
MSTGCGKFFEGNAAEMHEALNKRLAALPDDTVVYVSTHLHHSRTETHIEGRRRRQEDVEILSNGWSSDVRFLLQPGHEYTKSNVKFAISVSQTKAVRNLEAFATANQVTTGKFTIGDEKASRILA